MKLQYIHKVVKQSIIVVALFVPTILVSCQSDDSIGTLQTTEEIDFGAFLNDNSNMRSADYDDKEYDNVHYITSKNYDLDFYVELNCNDDKELGVYEIPSGYEGKLTAKDTNNPLMWKDLTSPHTFYAWTMPWLTSYDINQPLEPIRIEFHNSGETDYNDRKNNNIYETFIGARSKEVRYDMQGKYVPLLFHHLVSKIRIGGLVLVEAGGAVQKNLKADITFVGMPSEATFYPHPEGGGRPVVIAGEAQPTDTLAFFITNDAQKEDQAAIDSFYICPEVDFSKLSFKIRFQNKMYNNLGAYYGNFADVKFVRSNENYDKDDGSDEKVLHAGEMMTINFIAYPGIGPGISIIIDKWNTDEYHEAEHHTNPGIYSNGELQDIINIFLNQKGDYSYENIKELIERLFELYGQEIDGKKIFQLFDNVEFDSNILPIFRDFILDGMGHTIKMRTNSNNTAYVTGPYFNVGPVRDVYLTDGTNTIYIDSDGFIWIYDDETKDYKRTENQLTELTGDEKSYDISCKDGKVHKSTYYNNSITGS